MLIFHFIFLQGMHSSNFFSRKNSILIFECFAKLNISLFKTFVVRKTYFKKTDRLTYTRKNTFMHALIAEQLITSGNQSIVIVKREVCVRLIRK